MTPYTMGSAVFPNSLSEPFSGGSAGPCRTGLRLDAHNPMVPDVVERTREAVPPRPPGDASAGGMVRRPRAHCADGPLRSRHGGSRDGRREGAGRGGASRAGTITRRNTIATLCSTSTAGRTARSASRARRIRPRPHRPAPPYLSRSSIAVVVPPLAARPHPPAPSPLPLSFPLSAARALTDLALSLPAAAGAAKLAFGAHHDDHPPRGARRCTPPSQPLRSPTSPSRPRRHPRRAYKAVLGSATAARASPRPRSA